MRITRQHIGIGITGFVGLLLAGWLATAVMKAREAAARSACQGHFCQMALAILNHEENQGTFSANVPLRDVPPERHFSWMVTLMPYIEQDHVVRTLDLTEPCDSLKNDASVKSAQIGWQMLCPASTEYDEARNLKKSTSITHIIGVSGIGPDAIKLPKDHPDSGIFGYNRNVKLADLAGRTNTIMLMEAGNAPGVWWATGRATVRGIEPNGSSIGPKSEFGGFHHNNALLHARSYGSNVCMADASTRFITDKIDPVILANLARISSEAKQAIPKD